MTKSRQHSPTFKAKVVEEAFKEEMTVAELSQKHTLHPSVIKRWKQEALAGLPRIFENKITTPHPLHDKEVAEKISSLEQKVGQLTMENDFFKKKLEIYPCKSVYK